MVIMDIDEKSTHQDDRGLISRDQVGSRYAIGVYNKERYYAMLPTIIAQYALISLFSDNGLR